MTTPDTMIKLEEKQTVIKNFIAINVAFVLLFAAVNCTASFQPIINQDGNIGTISQSLTYGVQIITSLVLPQVICELIGFKYALMLGEILHMTYISVQIYPKWFTLLPSRTLPTSVLAGFGNSLCWTITGIYITICSKQYSNIKSMPFVRIQTLFFGFSAAIFLTSNIIGQALTAGILKTEPNKLDNTTSLNSDEIRFDYANSCGANNCPQTLMPGSLSKPTTKSFAILYASLLALVLLSILTTFFFMDHINDPDDEVQSSDNVKTKITLSTVGNRLKNEFVNLLKLCLNVDVWLLLPITIYTGFELTFIWFEFNRAFATCLLGVKYIGWANILFGGLGSILSVLMGFILKYIGTTSGIVFMLMVALCQNIYILSWTPNPNEPVGIFLIVVGFAFSQSVSNGQVRGLYGVYFDKNSAAFSAANVSQTTGLLIGSLVSTYFCTKIKSYVYIGILLFSFVGYIILSIKHIIKQQKTKDNNLEKKSVLNESNEDLRF